MTGNLQITVSDMAETIYTCVFEDASGRTARASTKLYGATVEIDKGKEFFPTTTDNQVECSFNSKALASISWLKELAIVEDTEEQKVVLSDSTIRLQSVRIDPNLDGMYKCVAEAFGMNVTAEIEIIHMGAFIAGPKQISIRQPVTLTCTAVSQSVIRAIKWNVNGYRIDKDDFKNSQFENSVMTSDLDVDPIRYAAKYVSKSLDFQCSASTSYGVLNDYVEATVLAAVTAPDTLTALETEWELQCTVVSEVLPRHVEWIYNSKTLHQFSDFKLNSVLMENKDPALLSVASVGEEGFLVEKGNFAYRQDGNDFFLTVSDSSYRDSGDYTCRLVYLNESVSESTSSVDVRGIVSPQPAVFFKELTTTSLTCILYSKTAPASAGWYSGKKLIRNAGVLSSEGTEHKTTFTIEKPEPKDAGEYSCELFHMKMVTTQHIQ